MTRRYHWSEALTARGACYGAVNWARNYPTAQAAWDDCPRGDWMLWLVSRYDRSAPWSEARKPLVRCAVDCAAEGLRWGGAVEAIACVSITKAWCEGAATREDVEAARRGAVAVYCHAVASAAAAAGVSIGSAADACTGQRRFVMHRRYEDAKIVRAHYPRVPIRALLEREIEVWS